MGDQLAQVLVVTPTLECPATLALAAEGVPFEVGLCENRHDYGRHLAERWRSGTGFVLVEWDIAPWPGAIGAIWNCPRDHCRYPYMLGGETGIGIGCAKFSAGLTQRHPEMPEKWRGVSWEGLDGSVSYPIQAALGQEVGVHALAAHEHSPPVAHVRRGALKLWKRS